MKYSSLTDRIAEASTDAWEVHNMAMARVNRGEAIIMLSIGQEADQFTAENIVHSAVQSLQQGRHHYTLAQGLLELCERIAAYHQHMTRQQVAPN